MSKKGRSQDLNELASAYSQQMLCPEQVAKFCQASQLTMQDFQNRYALHVAESYHCGELNFYVCDWAMNHLQDLVFYEMTEFCWWVYEAFDAGEHIRREDPEDVDPAEKYTRPMIAEALKSLKSEGIAKTG
jgi:hypothetical protein